MGFSDKKILIVEDDDMLRNIVFDQLKDKYLVIIAKDGQEALDQIELSKPDLIILDLLLPKVDGFTILEKLRANPDPVVAGTPVVVVSNLSDQESVQRAEQYKIVAYFMKVDVSMGSLTRMIERVFNPDMT
jgi:CheY-like chemotaxis protein